MKKYCFSVVLLLQLLCSSLHAQNFEQVLDSAIAVQINSGSEKITGINFSLFKKDTVIQTYLRKIEYYSQTGNKELKAAMCLELGRFHLLECNDVINSSKFVGEAMALYGNLGNHAGLGYCNVLLFNACLVAQVKDQDLLMQYLEQALLEFKQANDHSNVVSVYLLYSEISCQIGLYSDAEYYIDICLDYIDMNDGIDSSYLYVCYDQKANLAYERYKNGDSSALNEAIKLYLWYMQKCSETNTFDVFECSRLGSLYYELYQQNGDISYIDTAMLYLDKCEQFEVKKFAAFDEYNLAYMYGRKMLCNIALGNLRQAGMFAGLLEKQLDSVGIFDLTDDLFLYLAEYYEKTGKWKDALKWEKKAHEVLLANKSAENVGNVANAKLRMEFKEQIKRREQSEHDRQLMYESKIQRQRIINMSVVLILLLVSLLTFVVWRSFVRKKQTNQKLAEQNEEITSQRDEIVAQRDRIYAVNKSLSEGINYAQRIQHAVVPSKSQLDLMFGSTLLLWRPLNVVSGDFYWAFQLGSKKMLAVADCTGHGVPGGFMSMLGIAMLNDIVSSQNAENLKASDILDILCRKVIEALRQTDSNEVHDGMDIALCVFDSNLRHVQFAGACRPLIVVRDGQVVKYKPDLLTIGINYRKNEGFTNNDIDLQAGDRLYMFTDGMPDQIGYDMAGNRSKYMTSRFIKLLASTSSLTFDRQSEKISCTIDNWRSSKDGTVYDYIDDELIVGVEV